MLLSSLTLVAVALLGAVLAYWTWIWFAPRPVPRIEASSVQSGSVAAAGGLFGRVPPNQAAAAPTGIAIRLLGVVAASGGRRGYAVLQLEAKQILAVHEGEDISPGIKLAEVHADHVILERNGVRETLAWPQRPGSTPAAAPASAQADRTAAAQATAAAAAQAAAAQTAAAQAAAAQITAAPAPAPRSARAARRSNDNE